MVLKDSSALRISHNKGFQWWVGTLSMKEGWSWTCGLFRDTWGPTQAYRGVLPKSVNTRFLLLQQRGVHRFSQAWSALYILTSPQLPMMSSEVLWGRRMNGRQPSIRWKVRPMSPCKSSWIWRSDTWWRLHSTDLGGVIEGQDKLPSSKTIISSSMSEKLKGTWSDETIISRRTLCCFCNFFFACRFRRQRTELLRPSVE